MDSPTVSISVFPNPAKGKGDKSQATDDDANAFSISLEVAREKADGETGTASITLQGTATDGGETADDLTIEIETVVFSGDELADNLSASTLLGDGSVALTEDGAFGVEGSVSGSGEVRLEVGETLTFELPPAEGDVVGGQVTITNLFSDGEKTEGALVFAYDADDRQLACYCALGNETGTVNVNIDVPFARLDFKALDNASLLLENNSNFGIGDISVVMASVIEGLSEGASQLIDDVVAKTGRHLAQFVDFGHFGSVHFEVSRIAVNSRSTIDALGSVKADQDREPQHGDRVGRDIDDWVGRADRWRADDRFAS